MLSGSAPKSNSSGMLSGSAPKSNTSDLASEFDISANISSGLLSMVFTIISSKSNDSMDIFISGWLSPNNSFSNSFRKLSDPLLSPNNSLSKSSKKSSSVRTGSLLKSITPCAFPIFSLFSASSISKPIPVASRNKWSK